MIELGKKSVILAPMEGLMDAPMRAFQAEVGQFTFGVAPFLRVSVTPIPAKVFLRDVPELNQNSKTPTGLPIQVQLLGNNPELLAESAQTATKCGAQGIDLNFGCPAKTVNRHEGGAWLLNHPKVIREIVQTVRKALPNEIPVSAKLRLGWDDPEDIYQNAMMAAEGGADWITIHARTRMQNYEPPAFWDYIAKVQRMSGVPIIANGEIWTLDDYNRCRETTGCAHVMLGRGVLVDPLLSKEIADVKATSEEPDWRGWVERFLFWNQHYGYTSSIGTMAHLKEWMRMAWTRTGEPDFPTIRRFKKIEELTTFLRSVSSTKDSQHST